MAMAGWVPYERYADDDWSAEPGTYLTDGRGLFRIVTLRVIDGEALVELEDCATLATWLVTETEVAALDEVRSAPERERVPALV
jgi:hypothetical protein